MKSTLYLMIGLIVSLSGFTLFSHYLKKSDSQKDHIDTLRSMVNSDGTINSTLQELIKTLGLSYDGILNNLVQTTQKNWLRIPGSERWEVKKLDQNIEDNALPLCQKLGLVDTIVPSCKQYDYALLLGACASRVRNRLNYLIDLFNEGIRFNKIVILTGNRPLQPNLESEAILYDAQYITNKEWEQPSFLPVTEKEMIELVLHQTALPTGMDVLPIEFITAPLKENGQRPTTVDTVHAWLTMNPTPGSCLSISNQPYVCYQDVVLSNVLPQGFLLDTVGSSADETHLALYLDTLARYIWEKSKQLRT